MARPTPEQLMKALTGGDRPSKLYAVVDCARDPAIYEALQGLEAQKTCLYAGALSEELERSAPHLAQVEPDSPFLATFFEQGWGQSWGIFARSEATLEELRKHFRRFLEVETDDGRQIYFRYYDPRVFRLYLPTCTSEDAAIVFGPVVDYVMESEDGAEVLRFENKVVQTSIELE